MFETLNDVWFEMMTLSHAIVVITGKSSLNLLWLLTPRLNVTVIELRPDLMPMFRVW